MHEKKSAPIEPIDFTPLQQQSKNQTTQQELKQQTNYKIWLSLILLIICCLTVFLFLPDYVAKKRANESIAESDKNGVTNELATEESILEENLAENKLDKVDKEILSTEQLNELKLQSEELLLQVIDKQESLQLQAVTKWAEPEFKHCLNSGREGDEYFRQKNYQQAVLKYQETINLLDKLEQKIAPTLLKHLEQGELALTQAEKSTAILHFEMALAIDKNNQQASIGLQRSETIIELFALLKRGGNIEAANRLEDALHIYQQAKNLDDYSTEAKSAYDRVNARLNDQKFNQLIFTAQNYLKSKQYGNAKDYFLQAEQLQPKSTKPKQGLIEVAQAIRQDKITALRSDALHFESVEEWDYAAKSYQQILNLSPNSNFATDGLHNTQIRFAYLNKLDTYIKEESRLSTKQVADEAKKLLSEIALLENPGDKIKHRVDKLEYLLIQANLPISITLKSDNLTDIVVFKVAKFGKFENKHLKLKPGKYTLVGSRPGYRDIRKVLLVTADMQEKVFSVQCEEQI